jgi:hypothetical protein
MKYKENAKRIIELIKNHDGIETKQICALLDLTSNQFTCAQPLITRQCYKLKKKWRMTIVEEVPRRIRRSSTATIIYGMMPVSQIGLKERIGMHKDSIWRALKLLRAHNLIHISGYESGPNMIYPIFAKGYGIDAPRQTAKELELQRYARYQKKHAEKILAIHKNFREKNREILNAKQKERHLANREVINAKAREKARIKREAKIIVETLEAPLAPQISTQWLGGKNPFLSMMQ